MLDRNKKSTWSTKSLLLIPKIVIIFPDSEPGTRVYRASSHLAQTLPLTNRRSRETVLLLVRWARHQDPSKLRRGRPGSEPRFNDSHQNLHRDGHASRYPEQGLERGHEGGGILQEEEAAGSVPAPRRAKQA